MFALIKRHPGATATVFASTCIAVASLVVFIPLTAVPDFGSVEFEDGSKIIVEIAESPAARAKGLSGRKEIQESFGMLFLFSEEKAYSFWMPNMKFAIDIIWIRDDIVVDFDEDVSPENGLPLAKYVPDEPVNRVLEVRAGFVQRHGIDIGEKLEIQLE